MRAVSVFVLAALALGSQPALTADACVAPVSDLLGGTTPSYSRLELEQDINDAVSSVWKRRLLKSLLRKDASEGRQIVVLRDTWNTALSGPERFPLPYAFKLPRAVLDTFVMVARAQGLSPGERYVVLPARLLAVFGVKNFYSNVFFVLTLSGQGHILDAIGLSYDDPLLSETDPDDLGDNEHILVIKNFSTHGLSDPAALAGGASLAVLEETNPRLVVADISASSGISALPNEDDTQLARRRLKKTLEQHREKRFKKVIISGHGGPGYLAFERNAAPARSSTMYLGSLTLALEDLRPMLSPEAEIHFASCLTAATPQGEDALRSMARYLLPPGGSISASRFVVAAGAPTRLVAFLSPTFAELPMTLGTALMARAFSRANAEAYGLAEDAWRAVPHFRYVVPTPE